MSDKTCYCCHANVRASTRERVMAGPGCEALHRHVRWACEKHDVPFVEPEACPFAARLPSPSKGAP